LANPYILLIFTFSLAAELGRINNNTTDSILNMHKNVTVVSKETEDVINLVNMTTGNSTFLGEISINTPINNVSNLLGQNLTTISDASTTTPMMGTISLEKAKEDQTEPDMENDDYNLANEEEIVEKQQKQKPVQGNQADKDSTDKQAVRNTLITLLKSFNNSDERIYGKFRRIACLSLSRHFGSIVGIAIPDWPK
jgi:hypothetical protein